MKKLVILCIMACISASVIAQRNVRIGNMEIIVRQQEKDTTLQNNNLDSSHQQSNESENNSYTKSKAKNTYRYNNTSGLLGFGVILQDNGIGFFPDRENGYYEILGGNSINIDCGTMSRQQLTRWFALVGTLNYSFYNYKLYDAYKDPVFIEKVLRNTVYDADILDKHVYRSHNVAVGAYARFYLAKPKRHDNDGVFIDLGIQGDAGFSRYCKIKTQLGEKQFFRNDYAFNPYTASYIARVGLGSFSVFARYRFTDTFNPKSLPVDLPRLTVGVSFHD